MTTSRLRIALVQTQAENAGAQEISRLVSRGLEERGHMVEQIFLFRRTASFDDVANARICWPERPSRPLDVVRMLLRLRAELGRLAPHAVIAFQHFGNVLAAPVARSVRCPIMIANQVSASSMVAPPLRWADALMGSLGIYSRVVVNSVETEGVYNRYWAPYRRRLVRIDHGFQVKRSVLAKGDARERFGLPVGVKLAGCASRLHPLKQIDCAIRTLAINTAHHLAIAGQGSDRARLDALATALGVADRVHFVGELDPGEIGAFLAALDCFVHPSQAETFGLAPVEAAQAGVPVVVNRLEVLRDVLAVDGEPCALFADANDPQELAAAVDRVFTDPALVTLLRGRGARLAERYPVEAMVDGYLQLIETLRGEQPCASPSRSTALPSGAGTRFSGID